MHCVSHLRTRFGLYDTHSKPARPLGKIKAASGLRPEHRALLASGKIKRSFKDRLTLS
jgi:hypothetical protein